MLEVEHILQSSQVIVCNGRSKMQKGYEWVKEELDRGERDLYKLFACVIYDKEKGAITGFERTLAKLRLLDAGTRPVTKLEELLVKGFIDERVMIS